MNNCISAETLEKCVLQYYVRKHDEKIEPIYKLFREVDEDEDGVIDDKGLEDLALKINKTIDTNEFLNLIDPERKEVNIFSHVAECLLKHPAFK